MRFGVLWGSGVLAITGCGDPDRAIATDPTTTTVTPKVISSATTTDESPSAAISAATSTGAEQAVGNPVTGNRVILIGDSVMASTASRFHGEMCDVLVQLGWQAEVDAEQSKYIDFANTVLDRRLDEGWIPVSIAYGTAPTQSLPANLMTFGWVVDEGDRSVHEQVSEVLEPYRQRNVTLIWCVHPTSPPHIRDVLTRAGLVHAEELLGPVAASGATTAPSDTS